MPGKFIDKRTIAGIFDICPKSVDRLAARGPEFPRKVSLPFRHARWDADEIEAYRRTIISRVLKVQA